MRNPFGRRGLREAYAMGWLNLIFVPLIVLPGLAAGSLLWRGIDARLTQSSGAVRLRKFPVLINSPCEALTWSTGISCPQ